MSNIFLVARHEYTRRSQTRSFLFATVGLPLIMGVAIIAIIFVMASVTHPEIGVVDHGHFINPALLNKPQKSLIPQTEYLLFEDLSSGKAALETEEISILIELPLSYPSLEPVSLYSRDGTLSQEAKTEILSFFRTQLAQSLPEAERQRILTGWNITIRSLDGSRSFSQNETVSTIILPYVIGFFFFLSIIMSSSYLLQAVAEEKENRTMEVIITSLQPFEFIMGKSLGLLALALTQLIIWIGFLAGLLFALNSSGAITSKIALDTSQIGILAAFFLPSFALAAGIMIAIGSSVTEIQQGQQIAAIVNLFFIAPWMTSGLAFSNPNSPLMIGMTLFPTTSMLTIALRWTTIIIPAWQIILSFVFLCLSALFSIWISSKVFQLGMLLYGNRLPLRKVTRTLFANRIKTKKVVP